MIKNTYESNFDICKFGPVNEERWQILRNTEEMKTIVSFTLHWQWRHNCNSINIDTDMESCSRILVHFTQDIPFTHSNVSHPREFSYVRGLAIGLSSKSPNKNLFLKKEKNRIILQMVTHFLLDETNVITIL